MIIISKNLVLPDVTGVDPNAPRIGYRNLITPSNISADYEDQQFPARNIGYPATNLKWRSISLNEQYITVSVGANDGIDYVGFANHNFGTAGVAYLVQGSNDGSTWVDVSDEVIPNDDSPHVQLFELAVYTQYRVRLTPATDKYPYCAVIYIGRMLSMQRNLYVGHSPVTLSRDTTFQTKNSENGNFLGRTIQREAMTCSAEFSNLTPSWYRIYFDPFVIAARTLPFFWAWRPADYPAEVGFVWATDDIVPKNQRNNGMMGVGWKMRGIGAHISESAAADPDLETTT